jgi:hypothetical protein
MEAEETDEEDEEDATDDVLSMKCADVEDDDERDGRGYIEKNIILQ